jgi:PAS domain S-box-containing protein
MKQDRRQVGEKRVEKLKREKKSLKEALNTLKKEKKELERHLKTSRRLFHQVPSGLMIVREGRIIDINEAALTPVGFTAAEMIGRGFSGFLHPDSRSLVKDMSEKGTMRRNASEPYEVVLVGKTGRTIPHQLKLKKIGLGGKKAILINLNPIDRTRENVIAQSTKDQVIQSMASGLKVSLNRDLKWILDGLKALNRGSGAGSAFLPHETDTLASAVKGLQSTIHTLHTLTGQGARKTKQEAIDLRRAVKEAIRICKTHWGRKPEAKGNGIEFKTYLRSVSPVQGSRRGVQEMLVHVIDNAVEAMPEGGDLYLTSEENAGFAHIYVQDNGSGIKETLLDRIFDPYFTTKKKHMGLGLSVSRVIAREHGGRIDLTSHMKQGTTVHIQLPIASLKKDAKRRVGKRRVQNARILIINSGSLIMDLLSQLLSGKGFKIVSASSGHDGLNRLKKTAMDMVVASSKTTGIMDGPLCFKLKEMNQDLPIALVLEQPYTIPEGRDPPPADLMIRRPVDLNRAVDQMTDLLEQGD